MKIKPTVSSITIILITLIVTVIFTNLKLGKENWKSLLGADAKGYYAYLPAVFVYEDLNFGFFDEIEQDKYYNKDLLYDYRSYANGKYINKYYCGTALAEMPFFLIAHLSSYLAGNDMDGYSKHYLLLVNIAAIFYLLAGLLYLNATLKFYNLNEWHRSLTLVASVFGTHLFYYTISEPGMSHNFSFAFFAMFIYFAHQFFFKFNKKYLFLLGLSLGMITLIRPINGLIVFILPFIAGDVTTLKAGLKSVLGNKLWSVIGILGFLLVVSIQLIIYKISTGNFFVYAYTGEGFDFANPHIIDILFSYKKGLFLYTPILLLSFVGCYFLWKTNKFQLFAWLLFFIGITYIFSSWWMWFYGGSFSSRVYIEFIPIFMILMAIALKGFTTRISKTLFISLIVLLIGVCQIQTFQFRYGHIHWSEMTKEKYWDVFLRVDKL